MPETKVHPGVIIVGGLGLGLATAVAVFALAQAAPPTPPPGLANLYGKVTDALTGQPIYGVLVNLNGIYVYTDEQGNYSFGDLEPGSYNVSFEKEGYYAVTY